MFLILINNFDIIFSRLSKISMTLFSVGIISINIYFVLQLALDKLAHNWMWLMLLGTYCGFYIAICFLLSFHMFCCMSGNDKGIRKSWVRKNLDYINNTYSDLYSVEWLAFLIGHQM